MSSYRATECNEKNKLFYQISAAYYPLIELERLVEIEKENIGILSSYKDIASVKFQNGKGAMVDVLRVDIMLKDASTNLSILEQKEQPLETRFNKLLNRAENTTIVIEDSLSLVSLSSAYGKDTMLISNPLITALELKIQASKKTLE